MEDVIANTIEMDLSPSQEKNLERYAHDILQHDGLGQWKHEYEYKMWEVHQCPSTKLVFLNVIVGHKGDEGTLGEVIGRTHRHILITRGGGCTLLNPKNRKKCTKYFNTLIEIPD